MYNINGTRLSKTALKLSELQHRYVTFKHFRTTNFSVTCVRKWHRNSTCKLDGDDLHSISV